MEEIIHAFGIDWRLILIQVFNFVLLAGILFYFLYTPVLKMLSERELKIKKGIDDALNAEAALRDADKEKAEILKGAHIDAGQIVVRATAHAEEKGKAMLVEVSEKVSREIENAQAKADEIRKKALKDSEAEIAQIAILASERLLNTELSK